jgi:membrane protein implicated in regulation of membrane protease activity
MELQIDETGGIVASASGPEAVKAQAEILAAHMRQRLILRLGLYLLAALFVITAALLAVFAPDGRETITAIISFALCALAAGAAGFGAFAIKTPLGSAEVDRLVQRVRSAEHLNDKDHI